MHKYIEYKCQKIWTIHIDTLNLSDRNVTHYLNNNIPIKWQLILMSDGSFTQNLISLTGKAVNLNIVDCFIHQRYQNDYYTREIILKNKKHINFIFARSSWPAYLYNPDNYSKFANKPIGQLFIEAKIDIYKEIHEVYYGYCKNLERNFSFDGPIWGRKYTIYHRQKPLVTIHEIFSPKIIQFFT